MGFIYKITNDINNKVYIGKTNFTIEDRWKEHLHDSQRSRDDKRPLYNAINKYGEQHFSIVAIEELPNEMLDEREKYWIQYYDSYHNGYNATLGGDGRTSLNYDLIIKLYNQYQNVREVARQINADRTAIEDILHANGVRVLSAGEVAKQKFGRTILQIDLNTNKTINTFNSCHEAAKAVGGHHSCICRALKGERKTAYGYKWREGNLYMQENLGVD